MRPDPDDLDRLLAGLCDDDLSDADRRRLADLLQADPAARRRYTVWLDLHAELALEHEDRAALAASAAVARSLTPRPAEPARSRRPSWWSVLALAASVLVGVLTLSTRTARPPEAAVEGFAVLTAAEAVVWADPAFPTAPGGPIPGGPIELRSGRAAVRLTNGVEMTLTGPTRLDLIDPKSVLLHRGRLTARVSDEGIGFRVTTPRTDIVDLGTEFGVAVEDSGATEVHVAEGVVVARPSGGSGVVPILRHEAGRVDADRGDLAPVPYDPTYFSAGRADRPMVVAAPGPAPLPADARVVFLGDEGSARESALLLVNQALAGVDPGRRPRLYNSGNSVPLRFTEDEFQRYVARYRPTHALIGFASQTARVGKPSPSRDEFEEAVRRLAGRLERDGVEPVVATGYPFDPAAEADAQRRLEGYNEVLRSLARDRGYRLADIDAAFRSAAGRGPARMAPNGHFLNFDGQRLYASTLLGAFGRPEAPVPDTLALDLLPGVVREWRVQVLQEEGVWLDAAAAAALRPDDTWARLTLPQPPDPFSRRLAHPSHSSLEQERVRGMAVNLAPQTGAVVAVADIPSDRERRAFFNLGGSIRAVWLNGTKVYDRTVYRGYHPGFERVAVTLTAGVNTIVIEAKKSFFLSVTDTADVPLL